MYSPFSDTVPECVEEPLALADVEYVAFVEDVPEEDACPGVAPHATIMLQSMSARSAVAMKAAIFFMV